MRKLKICMLATDFPCVRDDGVVTYGGAGACMAQLVEGLLNEGVDVSVVTRREKGSYREIFDIPIHRTSYLNLGSRESKITHSIYALPKAYSVCKKEKPDVIHSHNPPAALPATAVGRLLNIPHLLTMHGPWSSVRLNPMTKAAGRFIECRALDAADRVTCDSSALKDEFVRLYGLDEKKLVAIPNAVDTSRFKPSVTSRKKAREKIGVKTDDRLVLYTGRFLEEKGLLYLLDAASGVLNKHDDVSFMLLGGGYDSHLIDEWIQKNSSLKDKIIVVPYVNYELMPYAYIASDVFALPTLAEGMSRSVLEAMACGLPVVATNVGGNPELVSKENGILVEPKNAVQIAEALNKILDDAELVEKMGASSREFAVKMFSVRRRVDSFIRVYEEMTG